MRHLTTVTLAAVIASMLATAPATAQPSSSQQSSGAQTTPAPGQDAHMAQHMAHMAQHMEMCRHMMGQGMMGGGMGPGMMRGGMMGGGMTPGMMGGGMTDMPMMMSGDPKQQAEMLAMRGEMLKAMGDIMLKYSQRLQSTK